MSETESKNSLMNVEDHSPINILLAEDDEADVRIVLRVFNKAKLKNNISVVRDGQEAIDFIRHLGPYEDPKKFPTPDLILLDINMPRLNGFEVLKELKQDPQFCAIPVIMLTSSSNDKDVIHSFKDGAVSFISKPIDYDDFVKVVDGFNFYWHIVSRLPKKSPPSNSK